MIKKVVVVWLSFAMVFSFFSIVDIISDTISISAGGILYVNETGSGGAYTSIQAAINAAEDGDTIFVYAGTYYENVVVNKIINLTGEDWDNTIINGSNIGDVIHVSANWVNITGFTATFSGSDFNDAGIGLYYVENCKFTGNNVSLNNGCGIYLESSSNNNLETNTIFRNNFEGILLVEGFGPSNPSNDNKIMDNYISSNNEYGISILDSSNNHIEGNTVISNNHAGISLDLSSDNHIEGNYIISNYWGIAIYPSSNNNIIIGNNVSNNDFGFFLDRPSNNKVYNNRIIDNMAQVHDGDNNLWNESYPIGGNYWSDYAGVDNLKGPKQNIPGGDGIGDTPYVIDSDSQDNYPLMEPYNPLKNFTVLKQGWNLISIPLIQKEQNLTRVLGTIDGWYDAVQWYDVTDTNDPWKHNKVGKPYGNDLFNLNETMGFWVHIILPGDTIFLYNGTQQTVNNTLILHPGWNLVGYPSHKSHNRTEGLNNLTFGDHIDAIWTYNSTSQRWVEIGETDSFQIGKGYYFHVKTKCEWKVPL